MMRSRFTCAAAGVLLAVLGWVPGASRAATFCADTSAEIQAALDTAETNGQADVVRIAAGTYVVPAAGGFRHDPTIAGGDDFDIEISGGWTAFAGNPCGQQLDGTDAFETILDGDDLFRVLNVEARTNGDVRINRLMFRFGRTTGGPERGAGLRVQPAADHVGVILVDRCAFLANESDFGSALSIQGGGTIRIRNSLFVINHARDGYTAEVVMAAETGVYFTNNTVIDNSTDGTNAGVYLVVSGTAESFVANNILWGNEGFDVVLGGNANTFRNNDFEDRSGSTASNETLNISVAPVFDGGILNYTPADGSALIDAGVNAPTIVPVPPPFNQNWSMGVNEFYGESRVRGARVDIGAAEGRVALLADGFESP